MRRLAALACVVALGAFAEEPMPPADEGAVTKPAPPATGAPPGGKQGPQAKSTAATAGTSPERFDPSEQISEDLSVSFPTDI